MLKTIFNFILTYRKVVLIGLVIVAVAGFLTYTRFAETPATSDTIVNPKRDYDTLKPNQSTHQNIIDQLGDPQSAYEQDGMEVYVYPSSTSYYAPDQLYVKDDKLQLIELHFTPEQFSYTLERLTTQYGQPTKTLYQPYNPYVANYVYVYPNKGIAAYITKDDKVFKVQRFSPIDLETYRNLWGKNLFDQKPTQPSEVDQHLHD